MMEVVEEVVETKPYRLGTTMKNIFAVSADIVVSNSAAVYDEVYDICTLADFEFQKAMADLEEAGDEESLPPVTDFLVTEHAWAVGMLQYLAGQEIPDEPCCPSDDVRLLRAKLTLEEAFETISALGFKLQYKGAEIGEKGQYLDLVDMGADKFDLAEVIDGCLDCRVIATGTILSCGVPLTPDLEREVDLNNIVKFRKDKDGRRREDGKWVKPSDHPAPRILQVIDSNREMLSNFAVTGDVQVVTPDSLR